MACCRPDQGRSPKWRLRGAVAENGAEALKQRAGCRGAVAARGHCRRHVRPKPQDLLEGSIKRRTFALLLRPASASVAAAKTCFTEPLLSPFRASPTPPSGSSEFEACGPACGRAGAGLHCQRQGVNLSIRDPPARPWVWWPPPHLGLPPRTPEAASGFARGPPPMAF